MIIESVTALAFLDTTNTFSLPPDWERQQPVQGCLREVLVGYEIPVVAQVRMAGKDPGAFYTPCTLPAGKYGGISLSNNAQQILELKPLTADLDREGWILAQDLDDEIEAVTGESFYKTEGYRSDKYEKERGSLDLRIIERQREAVGSSPALVSELERMGQKLTDVIDVSYFTKARI
ncbi:MAG: hypothetical protein AAB481_02725 [Patescibacteria group bacterium]